MEVPASLAALEAFKQLGCPADLRLFLVFLGAAVFLVNVRRADDVFLVVGDESDPVSRVVLVQPALDDWLQVCGLRSPVRGRLPEDEGGEKELSLDCALEV